MNTNVKTITITLVDEKGRETKKEIIIKKMAVGKYAQLLTELKDSALINTLLNLDKFDNNELIKELPAMIGDSLPDVLKLLSIVADIDADVLAEQVGLEDAILMLGAAIEVNKFSEIKKNLLFLLKAFNWTTLENLGNMQAKRKK
jgi:hypothetical protein